MKVFVFFLMTLCLCSCSLFNKSEDFEVNPETVLSTLDPVHPRLMMKDADLANLKNLYETDETLQRYVSDVIEKADTCLEKAMLEHKLVGPRLLSVSRECLHRVYYMGFAWRWTGDAKYAQKTKENLLTVCAFPDWNPSHFLDTAEMSHAVGVGYDWLFSYLNETEREAIKSGLIQHGMKPGIEVYNKGGWWTKSEFNWNQVCNSGLAIGALAIAETDPKYAKIIIPNAVKSLPIALKSYSPDGVWMEGPGYWGYATRYTAYGLAAMNSALGKDFGLSGIDGLSVTGLFPIYATGPTGLYLNYADLGQRSSHKPMPCMFWLAKIYNNFFISDAEHILLEKNEAHPEHVIWYVPPSGIERAPLDLDRYFRSPVEIAVFRSAWNDPNALFVGVKGGYNQVNHGHLDLGNFEIDALGERWARDLGADNYNLPGYWDKKKGGKRWTYYRLNSQSHNVPLLGGKDQDEEAVAKFIKTGSPSFPFVALDFSTAYQEFALNSLRGVAVIGERKAVLVQDEFDLRDSCDIVWGMTTDAEIKIKEKGTAELSIKDKRLITRILSPQGAEFVVESAEKEKPEWPNKGVKRLLIRLDDAKINCRIAVLLSPVWEDGTIVETAEIKPILQW
ncbi:heparinase II/III family protein [Candidatus Sumerlaeota bacterium]|nr:heparinase II/III family protein [Candidatus Sumerlaeota bacterium]